MANMWREMCDCQRSFVGGLVGSNSGLLIWMRANHVHSMHSTSGTTGNFGYLTFGGSGAMRLDADAKLSIS